MIRETTVCAYEEDNKTSPDSTSRPKRHITVKNLDISSGLSWREERDLKKALYASLQERRRNSNDKKSENGDPKGINHDTSSNSSSSTPSAVGNNRGCLPFNPGLSSISRSGSLDESTQDSVKTTASSVSQEPKKYIRPGTKYHAQRKFAQNVTPHTRSVSTTLPTPAPTKTLKLKLLPKATKTEDFLTFLCLRGTPALPPHLDLFNKPESPEEPSTPSLPSLSSKQDLGREGTPESSSSTSFSNNHEEDESETPTPNGKMTTPVGKAARACASTPQTARGLRGFKPSSMKKESGSLRGYRASAYHNRRAEMSPKHLSRGRYKVPPGVLTPASSDRGFLTPQKFLTPRSTPRSGSSANSIGRRQLLGPSKQVGSKRKALFLDNSGFPNDKVTAVSDECCVSSTDSNSSNSSISFLCEKMLGGGVVDVCNYSASLSCTSSVDSSLYVGISMANCPAGAFNSVSCSNMYCSLENDHKNIERDKYVEASSTLKPAPLPATSDRNFFQEYMQTGLMSSRGCAATETFLQEPVIELQKVGLTETVLEDQQLRNVRNDISSHSLALSNYPESPVQTSHRTDVKIQDSMDRESSFNSFSCYSQNCKKDNLSVFGLFNDVFDLERGCDSANSDNTELQHTTCSEMEPVISEDARTNSLLHGKGQVSQLSHSTVTCSTTSPENCIVNFDGFPSTTTKPMCLSSCSSKSNNACSFVDSCTGTVSSIHKKLHCCPLIAHSYLFPLPAPPFSCLPKISKDESNLGFEVPQFSDKNKVNIYDGDVAKSLDNCEHNSNKFADAHTSPNLCSASEKGKAKCHNTSNKKRSENDRPLYSSSVKTCEYQNEESKGDTVLKDSFQNALQKKLNESINLDYDSSRHFDVFSGNQRTDILSKNVSTEIMDENTTQYCKPIVTSCEKVQNMIDSSQPPCLKPISKSHLQPVVGMYPLPPSIMSTGFLQLQSYRGSGRHKLSTAASDDRDFKYLYDEDAKKSKKKRRKRDKSVLLGNELEVSDKRSKSLLRKKSMRKDIVRKVGSNFKKLKRLQAREKPIYLPREGTKYNENRKHLHPKKLKLRKSKRLQQKKDTFQKKYKCGEDSDYVVDVPPLVPQESEDILDIKKKKRPASFAAKLSTLKKYSVKKLKGKPSKDSAKLARIIETKRGKTVGSDGEINIQSEMQNHVLKAKKTRIRKSKSSDKTKSSADRLIKFEPFPVSNEPAKLVDIPIFYPNEEEFQDPLSYIANIQSEAEPYGMCKIEPPASWKLESKVNEEIRFPTQVQYLHKMYNRWGSSTLKLESIKKHLEASKVDMKQVPSIGGVEVDLPRLSQTVEEFDVVKNMSDKKLWTKVSDALRIPKLAQDRCTKLYDIYCKYVLSYDTLSSDEKMKLQLQVLAEQQKKEKANEVEDCIVKGQSMTLAGFQRLARNTAYTWCKEEKILPEQIESDYWKYVEDAQSHVVVQCGHVNTQAQGSGFPTKKDSPYGKHMWNLNNLGVNQKSVLHHLGTSSGATVPILHIGMSYSTSCWTTDHHFLPYIQYLHTGSDDLIWYCIPSNLEENFEKALKDLVPNYIRDGRKWLREDTIMVSPDLLVEKGVSVSQCVQRPRQFVVIFPCVYTASVSCGYTLSESAHFATQEWIPHGFAASEALFNNCEKEMFSMDELILSVSQAKEVSIEVLNAALPFLEKLVQKELDLRKQIFDAGLKIFRKMLPKTNGSQAPQRKRKYEAVEEEENLCDICKKKCYLSVVVNEADDLQYCLEHALTHVQKKKNLKACRLMYRHDEIELKTILQTVKYKIESRISELTGRRRSLKKTETRS